jgi:hypothetical protein
MWVNSCNGALNALVANEHSRDVEVTLNSVFFSAAQGVMDLRLSTFEQYCHLLPAVTVASGS